MLRFDSVAAFLCLRALRAMCSALNTVKDASIGRVMPISSSRASDSGSACKLAAHAALYANASVSVRKPRSSSTRMAQAAPRAVEHLPEFHVLCITAHCTRAWRAACSCSTIGALRHVTVTQTGGAEAS